MKFSNYYDRYGKQKEETKRYPIEYIEFHMDNMGYEFIKRGDYGSPTIYDKSFIWSKYCNNPQTLKELTADSHLFFKKKSKDGWYNGKRIKEGDKCVL